MKMAIILSSATLFATTTLPGHTMAVMPRPGIAKAFHGDAFATVVRNPLLIAMDAAFTDEDGEIKKDPPREEKGKKKPGMTTTQSGKGTDGRSTQPRGQYEDELGPYFPDE